MFEEEDLSDQVILVAVCGGIAAYKVADVVSKLTQFGAEVRVIMTPNAEQFITKNTFQALSGNRVGSELVSDDTPEIDHVHLAREADLTLVAPATYTTIGKVASGIADNLVTATIAASDNPVLFCPSMETHMYNATPNQLNLKKLKDYGHYILQPESGRLASGQKGEGRLPSTDTILAEVQSILREKRLLKGVKVLVTAGPTHEPIDPIRVLTNRSSGKMGYALAEHAQKLGGEVLLITGPTQLAPPSGVGVVEIETARELEEAVLEESKKHDLILMAAAVADWRPQSEVQEKLKKEKTQKLNLELSPTTDILKKLGKQKADKQVLVGFAAESENVRDNAREKMAEKNLNAIFANPISEEGVGPGQELNRGTLLLKSGAEIECPPQVKSQLARKILKEIGERFF